MLACNWKQYFAPRFREGVDVFSSTGEVHDRVTAVTCFSGTWPKPQISCARQPIQSLRVAMQWDIASLPTQYCNGFNAIERPLNACDVMQTGAIHSGARTISEISSPVHTYGVSSLRARTRTDGAKKGRYASASRFYSILVRDQVPTNVCR